MRSSDRIKSSPWIEPLTPPVSSDRPPTLMSPVTVVPFCVRVIVTGMKLPPTPALPVHTPATLAVGMLAGALCARSAAPQPAARTPHSASSTNDRLIRSPHHAQLTGAYGRILFGPSS